MTNEVNDNMSEFDKPRPLRLVPELPDGKSRQALKRQLVKQGMSQEAASAVARAVVEPAVATALLAKPTEYRVPGAELQVIRVQVYTSRVIADATNPRILNQLPFPAAVTPGPGSRVQFPPMEPPTSDEHEFTIAVDSLAQLIWQLDSAMSSTVKNVPRPPIIDQGIMEPPLAVAAKVTVRGEEAAKAGVVLIREGSSRASHAQSILGLKANDLIFRYVEDREQVQLINTLNTIANTSATKISREDAGRVRVATMPLDLVVGVLPDTASGTTLGDAVTAKVAQDHLNHKRQWDEAAKHVHLGDACLIALRDESLLTENEYSWLSGRLPVGSSEAAGIPAFEDDRWARLLWTFTTKKRPESRIVRRPIATVLEREEGRTQVQSKTDRIPLAVALAMRARRGKITETAAEKESHLLENAVPKSAWTTAWSPSAASIDELAETATIAAAERRVAPEGVELAVRAAWYLVKAGQVSMPRNDLGRGADRRAPSELIEEMIASVRGVKQLAQIVRDGRDKRKAGFVVDDDGHVDRSGIGEPVPLDDDKIRKELAPRSGPPLPPPRNPQEEFLDAIAELIRDARKAVASDEALKEVMDGYGKPMFEVEGVPEEHTADLSKFVTQLQESLKEYEMRRLVADRFRQTSE